MGSGESHFNVSVGHSSARVSDSILTRQKCFAGTPSTAVGMWTGEDGRNIHHNVTDWSRRRKYLSVNSTPTPYSPPVLRLFYYFQVLFKTDYTTGRSRLSGLSTATSSGSLKWVLLQTSSVFRVNHHRTGSGIRGRERSWFNGGGFWTGYFRFAVSGCSPIVQELCESRGGRPELSVLTSLLVSVDVDLLNRASALVTTCP